MDEQLKKEILELFKSEGLDVAEEAVARAVTVSFKVMGLVIPKVLPIAAPFVPTAIAFIEPKVLAMVDKIDGQDDPGR